MIRTIADRRDALKEVKMRLTVGGDDSEPLDPKTKPTFESPLPSDHISTISEITSSTEVDKSEDKNHHSLRKAVARKVDLEEIGSGRHRTTFALDDDTVIKVGRPRANRKEVRAWEQAPEGARDILCPLLDYDDDQYRWVVMARAECARYHDDKRTFVNNLKDEAEEIGMDIFDVIPKNVGLLDGKEVILDYGEFVDYFDPSNPEQI